MKRTTGLIGVIAIAMALTVVLSAGVAVASRPVVPTPETENIDTITMIYCIGMVTEEEKFTWDSSSEDLLNSPPLQDGEVLGTLKYHEDLKVTDGITDFVKDLGIDTGDTPNLDVMKTFGYNQAGTIGALSHDEDVEMSIYANPIATQDVIMCPFAAAAVAVLPASCEDVSMGSSMFVTEVLAGTRTKVGMSDSPIEMSYSIDATGLGGPTTLAVGTISAEMDVFAEDGSAAVIGGCVGDAECGFDPDDNHEIVCPDFATEGACLACGGCEWIEAENPLGSRMSYSEKSTASGLFDFHKGMNYKSQVRP